MASEKVETVVAGNYLEMESEEDDPKANNINFSNFFWNGGSVYDAWFSSSSNQVAQVLLTLSYSFSQLGMLSGILFQLFYGLMGSWTAYLISVLYVEYRTRKEREKVDFRNYVIQWFEVLDGLLGKHWRNVGLVFNCTFLLFGSVIQLIACASNIYYINDNLDKGTWTYIFGACCATTVFVPSFHNYRIWSFLGLLMTTFTSWYMTIASLMVEGVTHTGPAQMVLYFTGATNILYTFGGHVVTVIMVERITEDQAHHLSQLATMMKLHLMNSGLQRGPKWGHLKDLHFALKLCKKAMLWGQHSVQILGFGLEARVFHKAGSQVCAAFLANNNTKIDKTVTFNGVKYHLPHHSISILPDCKTVVFNTDRDPNDTLKRNTFELLYKMRKSNNVEVIVDRMISYMISINDYHNKTELASRCVELAEQFAPSNQCFILTMNKVFEHAGDLMNAKVAHNLMCLIAEGFREEDESADSQLRSFVVESYLKIIGEPKLPSLFLHVIWWVLGEYGTADGNYSASYITEKLCDVAEAHSNLQRPHVLCQLKLNHWVQKLQPCALLTV